MKEILVDFLGCLLLVALVVFFLANVVAFLIGIDDKRVCETNWRRYSAAKLSCFLSEKQEEN